MLRAHGPRKARWCGKVWIAPFLAASHHSDQPLALAVRCSRGTLNHIGIDNIGLLRLLCSERGSLSSGVARCGQVGHCCTPVVHPSRLPGLVAVPCFAAAPILCLLVLHPGVQGWLVDWLVCEKGRVRGVAGEASLLPPVLC